MRQRPSICTIIIGFVMFVSGAVAVAIEYVERKAESTILGGIIGFTISASGMVLFIGGIGWLCCTRKQRQDETFANGVVLRKHENTLIKSEPETDYQQKRLLDPATEDPVARRAIRVLQFKACPDTRLNEVALIEKIKKPTLVHTDSKVLFTSKRATESTSIEVFEPSPRHTSDRSRIVSDGSSLDGPNVSNTKPVSTKPTPRKVTTDVIRDNEKCISRFSPHSSSLPSYKAHNQSLGRPKTSVRRGRQTVNRPLIFDKELKIQLYREKKRQLEVKLRQHLQREALSNGSLPKDYGKQMPHRRNINGYATMPSKPPIAKSKMCTELRGAVRSSSISLDKGLSMTPSLETYSLTFDNLYNSNNLYRTRPVTNRYHFTDIR